MRFAIHVKGYYEWVPCPPDVKPTKADIDSGRVKPSANSDKYDMRVPLKGETVTEGGISEDDIIGKMIHAYCDHGKQGKILTRKEAIAEVLGTHVMPNHAHRKDFKHVEIHDDGPNEAAFRAQIAPYLAADHARAPGKCIDAEDFDELLAAYMEPCDSAGHVAHLHAHFRVKAKAAPPAPPAAPEGSK